MRVWSLCSCCDCVCLQTRTGIVISLVFLLLAVLGLIGAMRLNTLLLLSHALTVRAWGWEEEPSVRMLVVTDMGGRVCRLV